MSTEFVADPPASDGETLEPPTGVRAIPPIKEDLAGVVYTFHCPKLAVWADLANAELKLNPGIRNMARAAAMVQFVHASLSLNDSEEVEMRKLDPNDPLDLPDIVRVFSKLTERWQEPVDKIGREIGMDVNVKMQAETRPIKRGTPRRR